MGAKTKNGRGREDQKVGHINGIDFILEVNFIQGRVYIYNDERCEFTIYIDNVYSEVTNG